MEARRRSRLRVAAVLLFCFHLISVASGLKFDLYAQQPKSKTERCIRNFVNANTLVMVTATLDRNTGGGQVVNVQVRDSMGNEYQRLKDVSGEERVTVQTLADAQLDVCFENVMPKAKAIRPAPYRQVELDIEIGADAKDWSGISEAEKLKPVDTDLRRIEESVDEIVGEMEYLKAREQKLRDTNESTNERVKWFAFGTMGMLMGLGAWQIVYLRAYFRSKHLI